MQQPTSYIVYIVRCSDNTLYTGITTDTERRIKEHNGELPNGASYTHSRQPVTLVYSEEHPDRATASKREYMIKQLPRDKKLELITKREERHKSE
jgi:putative endonuclease